MDSDVEKGAWARGDEEGQADEEAGTAKSVIAIGRDENRRFQTRMV